MVKSWKVVPIGDILNFKNGLNKSKEFFGYGTPIVNYTDVYKKRGLKKSDIIGRVSLSADEIKRFDVQKNDVFFTRTSETPDEVGLSSVLLESIDNCVFSGFVLRGRPKNNLLLPAYCKYCFSTQNVRSAIISGCTYTTRALTNGSQLSAIKIPLPPLEEQQKIAEALSDLDEMIESLEKLIAKKKAIKQGAMQELLTGKKRLPGFTGKWAETSIENIAILSTATIAVNEIKTKDYIGTDNMISDRGGVRSNTIILNYNSVRHYQKDDILISNIRPYLKKIWFSNRNGGCSNDVLVLRAKDRSIIEPEFLYHQVSQDSFFDYVMANAVGTKMPRGDKNIIRNYIIKFPKDIEEQREITMILSDMRSEIEELELKLAKCRQTKQGMMQQLLTGKIRLV